MNKSARQGENTGPVTLHDETRVIPTGREDNGPVRREDKSKERVK